MFLFILLFLLGLILLIFSSNWLVNGASSIAQRLKISDMVIGLTIVSIGTSMPELVINIFASLDGNSGLAIGNIIGSNIFNTFVILGISAIIFPISIAKRTTWQDVPYSFLAAIILAVTANDTFFESGDASVLSRIDGIVFLAFFSIFLTYTMLNSYSTNISSSNAITKQYSLLISAFLILIGIVGLFFGGKILVYGAINIAKNIGLSDHIIGLTIVAAGTSAPELVTSVVASVKRKNDIVLGNIIGSNIVNIFFILGISSILNPVPFNSNNNIDIFMLLFSNLLLFAFIFIGKGRQINKKEGCFFVTIYLIYLIYLIKSAI